MVKKNQQQPFLIFFIDDAVDVDHGDHHNWIENGNKYGKWERQISWFCENVNVNERVTKMAYNYSI